MQEPTTSGARRNHADHGNTQQTTIVLVPLQSIRASEEKTERPLQEEEADLRIQSGGRDLARALHAIAPP